MRRILVAEIYDSKIEAVAERLGCSEIACDVPRFGSCIKSLPLPLVVVESGTNPGVVLGVFNALKVSREVLDNLEDLPEVPTSPKRDLAVEIDAIKTALEKAGIYDYGK